MYENKIITEPKWKSWIVQTTTPLFTGLSSVMILKLPQSFGVEY